MNPLWIVLIVGVIVLLYVVAVYNGLVGGRNRVKEAWSGIDVQLKRRHDLIPNLVETVKGYAKHEASVFENVTKARTAATQASSPADVQQAENVLTGALRQVFALSEAYPDLKANQNFLQLQQELGDTEDKIQAARRFYNGNVRDLNTTIQSFPGNIIAGSFGFKPMDLFELGSSDAAATEPVKVQF